MNKGHLTSMTIVSIEKSLGSNYHLVMLLMILLEGRKEKCNLNLFLSDYKL